MCGLKYTRESVIPAEVGIYVPKILFVLLLAAKEEPRKAARGACLFPHHPFQNGHKIKQEFCAVSDFQRLLRRGLKRGQGTNHH